MQPIQMAEPPWMPIARGELGIKEIPGPQAEARIQEYHATTRLSALSDEVPWCSSFVNWVMLKAGLTGTDSASADSWDSWGEECGCLYGAITVLRYVDKHQHAQHHVGFLAGRNEVLRVAGALYIVHRSLLERQLDHSRPLIQLLGGNQSDSVCEKLFDESLALTYRMPNHWLRSQLPVADAHSVVSGANETR